jgi:hypothetical protein
LATDIILYILLNSAADICSSDFTDGNTFGKLFNSPFIVNIDTEGGSVSMRAFGVSYKYTVGLLL